MTRVPVPTSRRVTPPRVPRKIRKQRGVTTVIPGARTAEQASANAAAGALGRVPADFMGGVHRIYDEHFRESVHPRW